MSKRTRLSLQGIQVEPSVKRVHVSARHLQQILAHITKPLYRIWHSMACLRISAQKGWSEGGGLACISAGLYHPLAAESQPGEVWTGRVGSSLTWSGICQVETIGVLFTLEIKSFPFSLEMAALKRMTEVPCTGPSLREERRSTHKGKQLNLGKSVAALTCCGLCPANLQPAVSRPSCCMWHRGCSAATR